MRRQADYDSHPDNVPGCPHHTAMDQRGDLVRTRTCLPVCKIMAEARGAMRLTDFLCKLLRYKDSDLAKADAAKAAEYYGINPDHAAGYIRLERQSRGMAV